MIRNVAWKRERGDCANFILALNLAKQPKHKQVLIVNALQIAKSAFEDMPAIP